jgi:hypothetical protein
MKPAALLCFAPALTAGAQGPDRAFLQQGNRVEAARYFQRIVDLLARAAALNPGVFAWLSV